MQKFLRILKYATYPFLWLSMFLFCGISFTFLTEFTVENRTEETIVVTPVGTGESGHRGPLPVKMFAFPPFAAFRSGEFRLAPDESISVQYDMDDITLSELVVTTESGRMLQLKTKTANEFHLVIDDLTRLQPVHSNVQAAAQAANRQRTIASVVLSLLFGPWLVYGIVAWMSRRR